MKLPRGVGTTMRNPGTNRKITRARKTLIRRHGSTRIKNCGTRIISIDQSNKESKPKDTCITVTKDVKYFCPTGYDEGIFSAVTKLLSAKIEQVKWSGDANAKTVNAIGHESFCIFFKIPEQLYEVAFTQVVGEMTPKKSGNDTN